MFILYHVIVFYRLAPEVKLSAFYGSHPILVC